MVVSAVCAAVSVKVGGETKATDALADVEPPVPVQLRVNVAAPLSAAVTSVPEIAFAPDQSPAAVQDVALVLLHVNVTVCPAVIEVGLAVNDTVGAGGGLGLPVLAPPPPPPQAASKVNPAKAENRRARRENSCGITQYPESSGDRLP